MSTPKIQLPTELLQEIASTNFGQYYTNPLFSTTIRAVLGLALTFLSAKVFKAEVDQTQLQDWVELVVVLGTLGYIAWARYRSTHQIASVGQAVAQMLPAIQQAATPQIREDLLKVVDARNPDLGTALRVEAARFP